MSVNYQKSLQRVTDYIYAHLEDELDLNRLAEVACLSSYHWHRVYFAMQGETVTTTVRRLRLQRAADRLANSGLAIKDIAQKAGYGSTAAFTRGFKQAYGQTPGVYRRMGSHAQYKQARAARDSRGFPVDLVLRDELVCAAVAHKGSYLQIDQAMGRLFEGLARQGLLGDQPEMMACFLDDPDLHPEATLNSFACSPVDPQAMQNLPAPLQALKLRGGWYARMRYKGPYADMRGAYRWLYGTWLPQSGHQPAQAPGYEEYVNSPVDVPATELKTNIYLPLQGEVHG